ncbi:MAG: hypothetical protein II630_00520 [Bacteroidales bacterium]|nr:hypothetical protein [Bacteroidales bacterium]
MENKVVRWEFLPLLGLIFCFQSCNFESQNAQNRLHEAEGLYLQGTSSNSSSQYESSTVYLKQAEDILVDLPQSARRDELLGLTWFHLGNTSESEMLYDIAQAYYRKAIPMLNPDSNAVYLACAYRDIARTIAITGGEQDSVLWYFAQADIFAAKANNTLLLLDIDAYRYQLCFPDSVVHRLNVCKQLVEEYKVATRYSEIVELLLAQSATDSAAYYLARLQPTDSAYTYWFEQSYAYLNSKILRQRGQADSAYSVLLDLYDRKIEELQRDAGARTYALSLHYDVAREQQLAAEAQRERQWQRTISVILILLLAVLIILFVVIWRYWQQRRREQARQLEALRDKYVQQLQLALERLQQKVNLTREIEMQRMRGNEVEFPKWLQTYRDEQLTMSKESLDELIASIDKALDGAISRLRAEYPELTESDMQFAILSIIGASDNDMSIVLNVQKQTIYHRRQIVRKHVNPDIDDIDAWLRQYVLRI